MKVGSYEIALKRWQVVTAIVTLVALLGVIGLFKLDKANKEGVNRESALNAQYQDNQNRLSAYISGFYEQTGVAKVKADKLNAILLDAVKGRYDGKTSAQPGGGSLFSAIVEAYPDLSGLDIYDKIVDYIQAGRTGYANVQTKLLDMLAEYQRWRRAGLFHRWMVSIAGFPSNELRAPVGTDIKRGQAALDRMYLIVLTGEAQDAYETGEMDPLQVPAS